MKPHLALRVSPHLALTPQLQQSIRLLQLSGLELNEEIEQALADNPFLERVDPAEADVTTAQTLDNPPDEAAPEFGTGLEDSLGDALGNTFDDTLGNTLNGAARDEFHAEFGAEFSDTFDAPSDPIAALAPHPDTAPALSNGTLPGASDNPELEAYDNSDTEAAPSWDGDGNEALTPDDPEWGGEAPARGALTPHDDADDSNNPLRAASDSLAQHLHQQALGLRLSAQDQAALGFLIDSLNDDGYLEEPLPVLAQALCHAAPQWHDELLASLHVALPLLQHMEPAGVGARDLGECLQLQLRASPWREHLSPALRQAALALCTAPLVLLAKRDHKALAHHSHLPEAQVREALAVLARLEPKPGRRFAQVSAFALVPDLLVLRQGSGPNPRYRVLLNPDAQPRLRVNNVYARTLRAHRGQDHAVLRQHLQEARWLIKNIEQRGHTLLRVAQAIVERQHGFLSYGARAMQPLVLREIAEALQLHESTVSRVTTAKYITTPQGSFELKYFFGSALNTDTGGQTSSTAVRALIQEWISQEDPARPVSDQHLCERLKQQGIDCARRTVAKYREALRLAPAHLRRVKP